MKVGSQRSERIVVVGGGLGGLSAAIALASEGFPVEIVEKNDKLGGKLNVLQRDGFTFDLGPSILTMPHVFQALFDRCGRRMEDYVVFDPVVPHWRNFFEDGTSFDLTPDSEAMREQLLKLGPDVPDQFARFLAYSRDLCTTTEEGYFSHGLDSFGALLRHYGPWRSLVGFDVFRNMDQGVRRFIKDEKLVDVLNYFAKYVGSSPYDAPALLNLLPHVQFGYGLWYVRGGMYKLAEALCRLANDLGVRVRLNTEVVEIQTQGTLVTGVRLGEGTVLPADLVVSNMEVIPAYRRLIKEGAGEADRLRKFGPSCSGLVLHLGVSKIYPQLAHHNFFYSQQPRAHFDAIFNSHTLSDDPTIYLVAPVKSDPGQAPRGCEVIKVLPHIPCLDPNNPLPREAYMAFRDRVLNKLERMGLTDLRKSIICEECWTPHDIEARYYSNQGSIYGVASDRWQNLGFKAPQRSRRFNNLYFVGGSVNPGGGMPMVTLSGQLVRDKIMMDLQHSARI